MKIKKVLGILFKVHNRLGPNYQERYYQRAIEQELFNARLPFEREKPVQIVYNNKIIGKHYLDFVIEDVILEIKTTNYLDKKSYQQVLAYLNTLQLPVAIIANFRKEKLEYKRIILPDRYLKKVSV